MSPKLLKCKCCQCNNSLNYSSWHSNERYVVVVVVAVKVVVVVEVVVVSHYTSSSGISSSGI